MSWGEGGTAAARTGGEGGDHGEWGQRRAHCDFALKNEQQILVEGEVCGEEKRETISHKLSQSF